MLCTAWWLKNYIHTYICMYIHIYIYLVLGSWHYSWSGLYLMRERIDVEPIHLQRFPRELNPRCRQRGNPLMLPSLTPPAPVVSWDYLPDKLPAHQPCEWNVLGTFCKRRGKGILGWRNSMCRMFRGKKFNYSISMYWSPAVIAIHWFSSGVDRVPAFLELTEMEVAIK